MNLSCCFCYWCPLSQHSACCMYCLAIFYCCSGSVLYEAGSVIDSRAVEEYLRTYEQKRFEGHTRCILSCAAKRSRVERHFVSRLVCCVPTRAPDDGHDYFTAAAALLVRHNSFIYTAAPCRRQFFDPLCWRQLIVLLIILLILILVVVAAPSVHWWPQWLWSDSAGLTAHDIQQHWLHPIVPSKWRNGQTS